MDKDWAENYHFLKNDLLKVSVVEVIDNTFKKIGIPMLEIDELLAKCPSDDPVWDVYKNGWTMGINQVEQNSTRGRVVKYKPKNISELCAFVAAVRPGFKSMYKTFESREGFSYGIKTLDDLIKTPQIPQSFIIYQEIQMAVLNYAGIPMTECYDIIKNISKKRVDKVFKYKEIFREGFTKIIIEKEGKTPEEAKILSDDVWKILEDSASYIFNAAHAYCTAIDSLYGAYLKSNYPVQFYTCFLQMLEAGSEKVRMSKAKTEAENAYNIYFPPMKFRQDNREIRGYPETNQIVNSLQSIKGFSRSIAESLYNIKDIKFDDFVDLLVYLEENKIMSTKIRDLIGLQYFSEFGGNKKLITIFDLFKKSPNKYSKTLADKTKQKRITNLKLISADLLDENLPFEEQIETDLELTGNIQTTYDISKKYSYVLEVDTTYAPRLNLYCLANGKTASVKVRRKIWGQNKLKVGDIIYCDKFNLEPTKKMNEFGQFVPDGTNTWWLDKYTKKSLPNVAIKL
jgi:DNA polymerase III alpha subunit